MSFPCRLDALRNLPGRAPETGSRLTCVLGLDEDARDWVEFAVSRGPDADPTWVEVPLEAGDLLWLDGRAPQRRPLLRVLYLDYRTVEAQGTFPWTGDRRARG